MEEREVKRTKSTKESAISDIVSSIGKLIKTIVYNFLSCDFYNSSIERTMRIE